MKWTDTHITSKLSLYWRTICQCSKTCLMFCFLLLQLLQMYQCTVLTRMEFFLLLFLSIKMPGRGPKFQHANKFTQGWTLMFHKMSALTFSQELGQVMTGSSGKVRHLAVGNAHILRYVFIHFLYGSFNLLYLEIHIVLFESFTS